jgi:hypothetical protein
MSRIILAVMLALTMGLAVAGCEVDVDDTTHIGAPR